MGRRIRSLCASLLITLVFAVVLFFIGWTQFRVSADSVGIISSKTGGVASAVVRPGVFSWHWEFLVPTNAILRLFQVRPYSFKPQVRGTLPSADDYSAILKSRPDFSYQFDFEIQLAVLPESLPTLIQKSAVADQQSLEAYLSAAADTLAKFAAAAFLGRGDFAQSLPTSLTTEEVAAAAGAESRFPELKVIQISVVSAHLPDWELYQTARRRYLSDIRSRQDSAPEPSPSIWAENPKDKDSALSDSDRQALELLHQMKLLISEDKI